MQNTYVSIFHLKKKTTEYSFFAKPGLIENLSATTSVLFSQKKKKLNYEIVVNTLSNFPELLLYRFAHCAF